MDNAVPEQKLTEMPDGSVIVEEPGETAAPQTDFGANLVETLDSAVVNSLGVDLLELIDKDKEARTERDKQQEEGIKRTGLGSEAPGGASFQGASRVVHPVMAEGCVDFSARAIKELFPANGPVKTKILGQSDEQKLEKARRKRDFLNHYTTNRMTEYRAEKEILLTQLPLGGSQYEKYWFNGKRVQMAFVPVDKVLLPFSANSFYSTPRLTHIRELREDEIKRDVDSKFCVDVFSVTSGDPEATSSEIATQSIEGKKETGFNEDGLRTVYEVTCNWALEGEEAFPYVVHIDEFSQKVCAIYRNWAENDPSKEQKQWWVEDKFIPWRGAYGIGLPHLIGGMAAALTGALRALLDSAHINNMPTAIKLKSGRTSGQNVQLEVNQISDMEAPANVDDIRKAVMPIPFNPPSTTLFQLLDWITNQAKGIVATAEEKIADASNQMPVGTALALIEQGSQVFCSVHSRLHESQHKALKIICRIISEYPDHVAQDLQRFGLQPQDFLENDDIEPVSDPNIFSESQRFAQMQSAMQMQAGDTGDPSIPWNKIALRRRMLELLRIDGIDELLPKMPEPLTSDPISENVAVMQGAVLKAVDQQDHQAHIKVHLLFILQPMVEQGPSDFQPLQALLQHIKQHLLLDYQYSMRAAEMLVHAKDPTASPDQIALAAALMAHERDSKLQQALLPELKIAEQIVQSKMPPPPVDPAIQKTFEAAMAEIQRKKEVDAAEQGRKDQAQQFDQSLRAKQDQEAPMLEELKRRYEAQAELIRMDREDRSKQMDRVIEMIKNQDDNRNHQMTELLKNRDDNETKLQIAALQKQLTDMSQQTQNVPAPDFSPMLKQMQDMLGSIEKAKTNDALGATIEGLRQVMAQLNAPIEFVRGPNGKALGARKVMSHDQAS